MNMLCVLGCSGNIASSLVRLLLDDSNHSLRNSSFDGLRLVSRQAVEVDSSAAATKGVRAIKVEVMIGDYLTDPTFLATAVEGCSALFLSLPQHLPSSGMHEAAKAVLNAFTADNADRGLKQHFVYISSFGIDDPRGGQGPLGEAHLATEGLMSSLEAACGLRWTALRPTSFFSNLRAYDAPTLRKCPENPESYFCSPLGISTQARVNWVCPSDIAHAAHSTLLGRADLDNESNALPDDNDTPIDCSTRQGKSKRSSGALSVIGPPLSNTLSAPEQQSLLSQTLLR